MRPLTDEQRTQIMHYFPPRLGKFVVPGAGVFDAPFYCLIINVEWIGHLVGVLDALDQLDAWIGTSEEIEFARQEVRRLITGINPCEESNFVLRQNPDDSCQLEQSLDGGVNWSLAFDYSLCLPTATSTEINNTIQLGSTALIELRDQYDDTPESILQGTESSPNLEDLLCYAIDLLIRTTCEVAADNQAEQSRLGAIVAGVLGVVAVVLAVPTGGASIAIYSVALSAALVGVASVILSISADILRDAEAQTKVICCMNEALQGSGLTETEFQNSLDSCGFSIASDEFILAEAFQSLLNDHDVYLAFLNFMHETDPFYQAGLYTCPCGDEWCHAWFSGKGNSPAWTLVTSGGGIATYDAVNDRIEGYKHNVGNTGAFIDMNITVNEHVSTLEVEIPYNATRVTASDFVRVYVNGSAVYNSGINGSGTVIETFSVNDIVTSIRILAAAGKVTQGDAGYVRVTKVIVNGNGDNPFGTDNC